MDGLERDVRTLNEHALKQGIDEKVLRDLAKDSGLKEIPYSSAYEKRLTKHLKEYTIKGVIGGIILGSATYLLKDNSFVTSTIFAFLTTMGARVGGHFSFEKEKNCEEKVTDYFELVKQYVCEVHPNWVVEVFNKELHDKILEAGNEQRDWRGYNTTSSI